MIARLGGFVRFLWEFVFGDDWFASLQLAAAIAITAAVVAAGVSAWWLLPVLVIAVLYGSLRRAVRQAG